MAEKYFVDMHFFVVFTVSILISLLAHSLCIIRVLPKFATP